MREESDDSLRRLAKTLGLKVGGESLRFPWVLKGDKVIYRELRFSVPVSDFLKFASNSRDEALRLANNFVLKGLVYLDRARLEKLVVEASRKTIEEKLKDTPIPEAAAFRRLSKALRELEERAASGFNEEFFPECVKSIIAAGRVRRLSEEEAYVLLSFLKAIGAPRSYLEELLGSIGVEEAGVLAEALGKVGDYTPFKCEALKAKGICDCDMDLVEEYELKSRRARAPRRL
ncbi:MAG: hypothetical protein P3X22_004670 [Thermoprotei archaeon]|nr:hypothetical protein [Thermoprotei archaeon]